MKTKNILAFLAVWIVSAVILEAQGFEDSFTDYEVTPENDTIIYNRTLGEFWFGALSGGNWILDFGELKLPLRPYRPKSENNPLIKYTPEQGGGFFIGFTGEWLPRDKKWGAGIKLSFWDNWTSSALSELWSEHTIDSLNTRYKTETDFNYLALSPYGRYNFLFPGLHGFAGIDIYVPLASESTVRRKFENVGDIDQVEVYDLYSIDWRFGGHIGAAWDITISDVNHRMRLKFTPFVSFHFGSSVVTENKSSWNNVTAKAGLSFKLGPDIITYDTLEYVPVDETPTLLAVLERESKIEFPGFNIASLTAEGELAAVDKALVEEEYIIEPVINEELFAKPEIIKAVEEKVDIALATKIKPQEKAKEKIPRKKLKTNVEVDYAFPYSSSTKLTPEIKKHLDQVSVYLKENPGVILSITGHSDNQGTFAQNDKRAKERAENVAKYLQKKGIRRQRLLPTGKGSIEPVASNKTAAGRRKNRRVVIEIIPPAKDERLRGR